MSRYLQKFSMPYTILIGDLNYGKHVGGDAIVRIVHEARLRFLDSLGPFSEISVGQHIGIIMTSFLAQFQHQLFYGDEVRLLVSVTSLRRMQFTLQTDILKMNQEPSHRVETSFAFFDYGKQKICPAPEDFASSLLAYREAHGE